MGLSSNKNIPLILGATFLAASTPAHAYDFAQLGMSIGAFLAQLSPSTHRLRGLTQQHTNSTDDFTEIETTHVSINSHEIKTHHNISTTKTIITSHDDEYGQDDDAVITDDTLQSDDTVLTDDTQVNDDIIIIHRAHNHTQPTQTPTAEPPLASAEPTLASGLLTTTSGPQVTSMPPTLAPSNQPTVSTFQPSPFTESPSLSPSLFPTHHSTVTSTHSPSENPTQAPMAAQNKGKSEGGCFSMSSLTWKLDDNKPKLVPLNELKLGDFVYIGDSRWSKVIRIPHKKNETIEMLKFILENGNEIVMTADHNFVGDLDQSQPASKILPGNVAVVLDRNGRLEKTRVERIIKEPGDGFISVHTEEGRLLVCQSEHDCTLASSYSGASDSWAKWAFEWRDYLGVNSTETNGFANSAEKLIYDSLKLF